MSAHLPLAEIADPSSGTTNVHTTRKVTQPPGGPTSVTISGGEIEEQDALSMAPPRGSDAAAGAGGSGQQDEGVTLTHTERAELASVTMETDGIERPPGAVPGFRPTRKVREGESQRQLSRASTDRSVQLPGESRT